MAVLTTIEPVTPTSIERPAAARESLISVYSGPASPILATPPKWVVTAAAAAPPVADAAWRSGSWSGVFANGSIELVSPTIGSASGADIVVAAGVWNVYAFVIAASGEEVVRQTHRLTLT